MDAAYPDAMAAAAAQPVLPLFMALRIELPATLAYGAKTLRMLDAAGVISWGGDAYVGSDGDYGTWAGISDPIEDALATQSPKFKTTFHTLTNAATSQLCQPQVQGAPVTLFYGYYDAVTGQPVSDPVQWFVGELDVGNLTINDTMSSVDLDICGASEDMFLANDGSKLNASWHNIFFPGETGFQFVDNVQHQLPWGGNGPRPDQVTDIANFDLTTGSPQKTTLRF